MQSQDEDEISGRRNLSHPKNKTQKNSTKQPTTKRPQLPQNTTDQRQDNTNRQGNDHRQGDGHHQGNENEDSQPVNSQRSNGKPLLNLGRGGAAAAKHLPMAAESKTNKQRHKPMSEDQNRSEDSKTIKEYSEYHQGNGYNPDDDSDYQGNGYNQKKRNNTQKGKKDEGTKQGTREKELNNRNIETYDDYEETETRTTKRFGDGLNTITRRYGNGYHHDDDYHHDDGEARAQGKRGPSKERNADVKEKAKKVPVASKKPNSKNQEKEEQLVSISV